MGRAAGAGEEVALPLQRGHAHAATAERRAVSRSIQNRACSTVAGQNVASEMRLSLKLP